jgi:hypothetical protein
MTSRQVAEIEHLTQDEGWTFEDAYEMIMGEDDHPASGGRCGCEDYPCCGH